MNKCAYNGLFSPMTSSTGNQIFLPKICSRRLISTFFSKCREQNHVFSKLRRKKFCKIITASSELILEGDLLVFRRLNDENWSIGAVVEKGSTEFLIRPIYSRDTESTSLIECFVNWDPTIQSQILRSKSHEMQLLDVDYEVRVIQDRLENPHGEESEDCWKVSSTLLEKFKVKIHTL